MTKLEEIVAYKRVEVAEAKRALPISKLERQLRERPPIRPFRQAIHRQGSLSLIAEIKRASPSAGTIRPEADAAGIAKRYAGAGVQAISVLTDTKFFSGSLKDLEAVREAVAVPILRKDFLLEEYQVIESAGAGADVVLLIMAILEEPVLKRLIRFSHDLGIEALVEVHTEQEVKQALEAGATVLGINNRDLKTFQVDLQTLKRLRPLVPPDRTVVSESGIRSRADVEFVLQQGVHAVLIGEELMVSRDVETRIKELMGCG